MKIETQIANEIIKNDKIALFHHIKPDGDSISSSYGLLLALKDEFPKKEIVWVANKEYLLENYKFLDFDHSVIVESIDDSYLTIVGDTSVSSRTYKVEEYLKGHTKICFDHHRNDLDIEADIFWSSPECPASAIQAILIGQELKLEYKENAAFFSMLGLLSDTGHFSFSGANEVPVRLYADMLKNISDEKMGKYFIESRVKTQLDLEAQKVVLDNLVFDGNVAYSIFEKDDIDKFGFNTIKFKLSSIANIENYPVWLFFSTPETKEDYAYSVNIRSAGPAINKIAEKHNGGGHLRAAGCKAKDMNEVKEIIKDLNEVAAKYLKQK